MCFPKRRIPYKEDCLQKLHNTYQPVNINMYPKFVVSVVVLVQYAAPLVCMEARKRAS